MADQLDTFEFKDPKTGDVYEIRAKDQDTAFAAYQRQLGPSVPEDMAKAAGVGVAKGAIGLPGLPGNVEALGRAGINWGAKKLGYEPPMSPETVLPTGGDLQKRVEEYTGPFYEPKTTPGKIAERVGEFAPGALFPGSAAQRIIGNVIAPAGGSYVGEGVGKAVGGDTGQAIGGVAGALLGPAAMHRALVPYPAANPEHTRLSGILNNERVRQTAGDRTGNIRLRYREDALQHEPFAGDRFAQIKTGQGEDVTRAVADSFGENANRVTPQVFRQARDRIGGDFNRVLGRNVMVVDQPLENQLQTIGRDYDALVGPGNHSGRVGDAINDVMTNWGPRAGGAGGVVDGAVFSDMRQRLFHEAQRVQANDPNLARTLWDIRNALDDAFERSLNVAGRADDLAAWRTAREQWRNLLVAQDAGKKAGAEAGILSPAALRQAVVGRNEIDYLTGQGRLEELSRAAAGVLKPLPQSGTHPRTAAKAAFTAAATLGGHALDSNVGAMLGAAASIGAPALANRAIMSRPGQRYLAQQGMLPGMAEIDPVAAALAQIPSEANRMAGNDYFINKDGIPEINIKRK